jgi:hypothetical protein
MTLTAAHISPIIALVAGILILVLPRLLNYVVAIYLIHSVLGIVSSGFSRRWNNSVTPARFKWSVSK